MTAYRQLAQRPLLAGSGVVDSCSRRETYCGES
jgi:hypothetical protein